MNIIYLDLRKGDNKMRLTKNNITKTKGKYKPKALLILVDEMSEVMSGSDFRKVSSIQENIGSIARLGRAAGVHLCLATQRPSSNVINSDLKNNIQQSLILGDFDAGASSLIFDEDVSHLSKPEIKGRGFIKSGKEITEFQSYWTEPKKDFRYVDTVEVSPVFMDSKQKNRKDFENKRAERLSRLKEKADPSFLKNNDNDNGNNSDKGNEKASLDEKIRRENELIEKIISENMDNISNNIINNNSNDENNENSENNIGGDEFVNLLGNLNKSKNNSKDEDSTNSSNENIIKEDDSKENKKLMNEENIFNKSVESEKTIINSNKNQDEEQKSTNHKIKINIQHENDLSNHSSGKIKIKLNNTDNSSNNTNNDNNNKKIKIIGQIKTDDDIASKNTDKQKDDFTIVG